MTLERSLRRKDREMSPDETRELLRSSTVAHLATVGQDGWPYVIPMTYIYDGDEIIMHSAWSGHKLDNLKADDRVCLEIMEAGEVIRAEDACRFSVSYRTVVAFGRARIVDGQEAVDYLARLARAFAGDSVTIPADRVTRMAVIVVSPEKITGKKGSP